MNFPEELLYTPTHEWGRRDGNLLIVGITDYAQTELGDITYLELQPVGRFVEAGQSFGVIESVKADAELYAPVSGTVFQINEALTDHPEKINQDPYGEGWIIVLEISDPEQLKSLLSAEAYRRMLEEEGRI